MSKSPYLGFKTVLDKIFAFLGVVILLPLYGIVALMIRLESKGKAVFKQERIGKDEKVFYMYKFRTMKTTDVPFDVDHPVIQKNDENVTKVGKLIRRLKVDESLQLLNVLRGEMSLVGPRPLLPDYFGQYEEWEKRKFSVRPGMTGLAQVKGNGYLDNKERSYYDVFYAENPTWSTDVKILFKTIGVVLRGEEKYLTHVSESDLEKMKSETK